MRNKGISDKDRIDKMFPEELANQHPTKHNISYLPKALSLIFININWIQGYSHKWFLCIC